MKIKGLDNGYLYTKDNEKRIFRSAYTRVDKTLSDATKIIIDGETYFFGKGNTTTELDKTDNLVNKVCTLANLAMTGNDEYYLVVGLPIMQYKEMKERYRESIMQYNGSEVTYQDKSFRVRIKDVSVFTQGAGAMFGIGVKDGDYIVFDVGSYTINVAYIEMKNGIPRVSNYDTWFKGSLILYSDIINELNRRQSLSLPIEYAEKFILSGFKTYVQMDLSFVTKIMDDYFADIMSKFKLGYPLAVVTPILLCGGGAWLFKNAFEKYLQKNYIFLENSQFANAIGYYNFGLQKYGQVERRIRYA